MNGEWKKVVLSDYINVKHGFAFKGEFFSDEPTTDVLVTPGNFSIGGGFKSDKYKYYQGAIPEDYILQEGDLIVTMTDLSKKADTLGYSALIPSENGLRFLHNQRVGLVKIENQNIDKLFLFFLLRSNEYRHHVVSSATGSTVKHTSPSRITSFEFTLPPKHIQKSIGSQLYVLEQKIQLNQQINQTLEQMAQALFKSWFVDFEPTKAKIAAFEAGGNEEDANLAAMQVISGKTIDELAALKTQSPENYQQLYVTAQHFPAAMQESELGEIPKGWGCLSLDKVANYLNGLALQKFRPEDGDVDFLPVLKIAHLRKGATDGEEKASINIKPEYIVNNGDVIFSWSGSLLVDIWCGGKAALNQHLFKVTSDKYPKWFYYYYTKHHLDEFQRIASYKAVTMGHIKRSHLKEANCAAPDLLQVEYFSTTFESFLNKAIEARLENNSLFKLRDELLPKLLSGELSVENLDG